MAARHASPRAVSVSPAPKAHKVRVTGLSAIRHYQPVHHHHHVAAVSAYQGQGGSYAWAHSRSGYRVANCESGDRSAPDVNTRYNGDAHLNDPNGHYGKWQFSPSTWRSVGGSGNPADASEGEQDARAYALYSRDGWNQWQCAGIMGVG